MKVVSGNKRAFHDYQIIDRYEAGMVLTGDEVKSLRKGSSTLTESYALIKGGEIFLVNFYIAPYECSYMNSASSKSKRDRKLLLNKKEISKLSGLVSRKGMTLVPLRVYFNQKGLAKVEIATAKHKNVINRKQELKERDLARQTAKELKDKN